MAALPIGLAFLMLAPSPDTTALDSTPPAISTPLTDHSIQRASGSVQSTKIHRFAPPLPKPGLPLAIDKAGVVHEPVIQAIYEAPASASDEALPSPQSPRRLTDLPPLTPKSTAIRAAASIVFSLSRPTTAIFAPA